VQHEWESGKITQWQSTEVKATFRRNNKKTDVCGWKEMCYCGSTKACTAKGTWTNSGSIGFTKPEPLPTPAPAGGRRLEPIPLPTAPTRALQGSGGALVVVPPYSFKKRVKSGDRAKVRVCWGLDLNTGFQMLGERLDSDMWGYSTTFDLRQPWAQRNIFAFAEDLKTNTALRTTQQWSWIVSFRNWLINVKQERFPVQTLMFDSLALEYVRTGSIGTDVPGDKYVWVVDGTVKALYSSISIDHKASGDNEGSMAMMEKWDAHIDKYNAAAHVAGKGAVQVSQSWASAEASTELIMSAVLTLVILLVLAFSFMVMFTWSVALSLFVVMATLAAIGGLCFFIVCVMQWELGLIEVIAIVYFIGYAVTYSLHIAHKYAHTEEVLERSRVSITKGPGIMSDIRVSSGRHGSGVVAIKSESQGEIRRHRTRFAIVSMGGATLGSAATTAGSSVYLCFATLTIFQRLGSMCLAVTLVSIVVALGPLPAGLMLFGPVRPGQGGTRLLQCILWPFGWRPKEQPVEMELDFDAALSAGDSVPQPLSSSGCAVPQGVGRYNQAPSLQQASRSINQAPSVRRE